MSGPVDGAGKPIDAEAVGRAMTARLMRIGAEVPVSEQHAGEAMPCPFCGGRAEVQREPYGDTEFQFTVMCQSCCATSGGGFGVGDKPRGIALSAWNRRAPSPQPQHAGEHSPEPWTYEEARNRVWDADGHLVCEPLGDMHEIGPQERRRNIANGRRIADLSARAPALQAENARLREALQGLMWRFEDDDEDPHSPEETAPDILQARSALRESGVGK